MPPKKRKSWFGSKKRNRSHILNIKRMNVRMNGKTTEKSTETKNATENSLTIVKCESLHQDMSESIESDEEYWTELPDTSPKEIIINKKFNPQETIVSGTDSPSKNQIYKCVQCGHMNTILPASLDGFLDSSQSIDTTQTTNVFQVSIHPHSVQSKSDTLSTQSNRISAVDQNFLLNGNSMNPPNHEVFSEISETSVKQKKKKRISFPGDVRDDDELVEESAQKYIAVLRKSVKDYRTEQKTLRQQNRRYQRRITTLKTLLKELVEKTKNGNYVIEA